MNWTNFWFLMAAIYTAPHMHPAVSILLGFVLFAIGIYSMRNGD